MQQLILMALSDHEVVVEQACKTLCESSVSHVTESAALRLSGMSHCLARLPGRAAMVSYGCSICQVHLQSMSFAAVILRIMRASNDIRCIQHLLRSVNQDA